MRRAVIRTLIHTLMASGIICAAPLAAAQQAAPQQDDTCGQAAFAAVVGASGGVLSAMNDQNKRQFTEKLQALKVQERWSDADYAVKARPFVQDEKIMAFDARGKELLVKVQALGGGEAVSGDKRCAVLNDLKALLGDVVKNTTEKWEYMFARLSGSLKPAVAGARAPVGSPITAAAVK